MISLRRKLYESRLTNRKVALALILIAPGTVYYFLKHREPELIVKQKPDEEVLVISGLNLDVWVPDEGHQYFKAGKCALIEPNQFQLSESFELTNRADKRKFDRVVSDQVNFVFQANNAIQLINNAQLTEIYFPKTVKVWKQAYTLTSSEVKIDYKSQIALSEKPTEYRKGSDQMLSENGFYMEDQSGKFIFHGPISGQLEKIP